MSLHRLVGMTVAVPAPQQLTAFYGELGLGTDDAGRITSPDGGPQITVEAGDVRRLVGVEVGADDERDLGEVRRRAEGAGLSTAVADGRLTVTDPVTAVRFTVAVADRLAQQPSLDAVAANRPGATVRGNRRAPALFEGPRPPRRLGHLVIGTPDMAATRGVLVDVLGFKVSDEMPGIISFLRCSTDHHNVALVRSEVPILQHYSWECDDVDHVGHAATALLRADPARQAWGFGRHHIGSNFYWYLRDPAGSFVELFSDLDVIDDDDEWERTGRTPIDFGQIANSWGPDVPMEFIVPTDLDELRAAWSARS